MITKGEGGEDRINYGGQEKDSGGGLRGRRRDSHERSI